MGNEMKKDFSPWGFPIPRGLGGDENGDESSSPRGEETDREEAHGGEADLGEEDGGGEDAHHLVPRDPDRRSVGASRRARQARRL
ncbi:hypothetical protein Scep_006952 [Stephania cephalantha]|uniref:Uncharacterized protein n=1 Tax=Stephania cephalantha TaxID=152367 RepID=A0AAP0PND8_9MAGN